MDATDEKIIAMVMKEKGCRRQDVIIDRGDNAVYFLNIRDSKMFVALYTSFQIRISNLSNNKEAL